MTNKILLDVSTATGTTPDTTAAADRGEALVNTTDRKIYVRGAAGEAVPVSQKIEDHDPARAYKEGDLALNGTELVQCKADIAAKAYLASDWTIISPPAGVGSTAILKAPTAVDHNTIDTTGNPTYLGLVVAGDPLQSVDLLRVGPDGPGGVPRSRVDFEGVPSATLSGNVMRITQVGHGLTARGQPVAWDGSGYAAADANLLDSEPFVGIVEEVLSSNSFILRTSGICDQLQAAAFPGGVITDATLYYLQDAAGTLGTTPASTGQKQPAVYVIEGTTGIVLAAPYGYVGRDGDEMTGGLSFGSSTVGGKTNVSRHIDVYGGTYGLSVQTGILNVVSDAGTGTIRLVSSDVTVEGAATFEAGLDVAGAVTISDGNLVLDKSGDATDQLFRLDADTGQNQRVRFTDGSGSPLNIVSYSTAITTNSQLLELGDTAFDVVEFIANTVGRYNWYCGTGNLDAALDSNGFYLFGSTGLVTTGALKIEAEINESTLAVTAEGITIGHDASNAYFDNALNVGDVQFRFGGTTEAYIDNNGDLVASSDSLSGFAIGRGVNNAYLDNIGDTGNIQFRWGGTVRASFDNDGSLFVERDGTSGTPAIVVGHGGANAVGIYSEAGAGKLAVNGPNGSEAAVVDNAGTTAGEARTVMTREKGDDRYAVIADGIKNGSDWSNPTRSKGSPYTNGSSGYRMVSISVSTGGSTSDIRLQVNDGTSYITVAKATGSDRTVVLTAMVPAGRSYRLNEVGGTSTVTEWAELS